MERKLEEKVGKKEVGLISITLQFCMGLTKTVREWRTAALEWSDCGNFIEDTEIKLHELTGQELMDYISVIWEIGFEEVKEIKLKN